MNGRKYSVHPLCNFVLGKNAWDVYLTPQGTSFSNVIAGIAVRTPSLLCHMFSGYSALICASLCVLSMLNRNI